MSTPTVSPDAVVVGAGVNGMVAAAVLARAGWDVVLVDRNERIGGFIASGEATTPGYVDDLYSSWHPLFVTSPAFAELGPDLARHGLSYRNTDGAVTASVGDDGRVTVAHRDPETTARALADRADRSAYLAMVEGFAGRAGHIGALMGADLRSLGGVRAALGLGGRLGLRGTEHLARDLLASGRSWAARTFRGREVDHLWVPWLLHAGLSPDSASGGFMLPVFAASTHLAGLPVVEGGAGNFVAAFEGLLAELGVRVVTGTSVEQILVRGGRAVGVSAGGRRIPARRAVLASVSPQALYGQLLGPAASPRHRAAAASYRPGRAAMHVHVTLDRPLAWTDERLADVPLVHVSDGSASTGIACAEAEAGLLPRRPTVVVGRQHLLDHSRVPPGAGALWLQLQEVPFAPVGDAAGELRTDGGWTAALAHAYAERVLQRVAAHAPNLDAAIRHVRVTTPPDLLARNPNAVAGDPYGGSAELDQNLWWRPFPDGAGRTGVDALLHIGAAVHPGPGLGAGSGYRAATRLVRRTDRPAVRRPGPRPGPAPRGPRKEEK
ncbi:phytoene desaturase family protein [Georgenia ruanii]|uniref:Pyridine nucleotide-disulfide oxidoreductase domain-containing protein 2 n=1 Tax=Georgenia ruanii TaxID=348442 RepID=A0A7J9UZJ9_9MICO|nr:NAD(P)/FAD-dependent oxidoreductase [Georgenia ruanii]MPV89114.1 FAD-dependent oxidoreductase [Georgenia ruanii]